MDDSHFGYKQKFLKNKHWGKKEKEEVKEKREVESEPTQQWLQLSSAILLPLLKEPTISFEM